MSIFLLSTAHEKELFKRALVEALKSLRKDLNDALVEKKKLKAKARARPRRWKSTSIRPCPGWKNLKGGKQ